MKTGTGEIHIRQVAVLEDDITELRFFYAATDQYAVCKQAVLHTHIFRFKFEYSLIPERIFRQVFSLSLIHIFSQLAIVELPEIGSPEGWINLSYPSLGCLLYTSRCV